MKAPGGYASRAVPRSWLTTEELRVDNGWEMAAAGYAVAIALYVLAYLIVALANLPGGLRLDFEAVFSRDLLVAAPATITAITLATRRRDGGIDALGTWFVDFALTVCFWLGLLFVIAGLLGFLVAFADFGTSASLAFYDLLVHLAGLVLGGVAVLWSARELGDLSAGYRSLAPGVTSPAVPAQPPQPQPPQPQPPQPQPPQPEPAEPPMTPRPMSPPAPPTQPLRSLPTDDTGYVPTLPEPTIPPDDPVPPFDS